MEVALGHFSWEILRIDEVHLVEQCLKDFSFYAIQLSLAYRSCCVDTRICLLLLSGLISLRIIITFTVLLHPFALFEQNTINTKHHAFLDNQSHLMLIDLAILIVSLVLFDDIVLHFLVSLQQNNSFLYEEDVGGWNVRIVNNFFSLVRAKGHAACQVFR